MWKTGSIKGGWIIRSSERKVELTNYNEKSQCSKTFMDMKICVFSVENSLFGGMSVSLSICPAGHTQAAYRETEHEDQQPEWKKWQMSLSDYTNTELIEIIAGLLLSIDPPAHRSWLDKWYTTHTLTSVPWEHTCSREKTLWSFSSLSYWPICIY